MSVMTAFVYDETFQRHEVGPGHPERPARLAAILQALQEAGLLSRLLQCGPPPAPLEWLQRIHEPAYIARLEEHCKVGTRSLDPDTHISQHSYAAACRAAGAGLLAADLIMEGRARNAFCAVRPPGHHAEVNHAAGFCLFNNIAVTARYLQQQHGLERVFIVDFDVHHGNGTQHSFEADPSVYFFSIHQFPFYPGTGAAHERGRDAGRGATLNVPLPAGSGDRDYLLAFDLLLAPELEHFKPQCLLVSAGFDAHNDDPLAGMRVSDNGFLRLGRMLVELASEHCNGRLISFLEGGYNLEALGRCVTQHVATLHEAA